MVLQPGNREVDQRSTCIGLTRAGEQCNAPAVRGSTMCRFHGGRVVQEVERTIARMNQRVPAPVPLLEVRDFPRVCAEYISRFNRVFARLEAELDEFRNEGHPEIDVAREYSDILDRQQRYAQVVTQMMQAAALLGIADNLVPDPDAEAKRFMESVRLASETLAGELARSPAIPGELVSPSPDVLEARVEASG